MMGLIKQSSSSLAMYILEDISECNVTLESLHILWYVSELERQVKCSQLWQLARKVPITFPP